MPPALGAAAAFGISYRSATDEDLPFLARLYASTRAEELALTGWPAEAQARFLAQQFDAQHRHYQAHYPAAEWLMIELRDEAVGRLYLEEQRDEFRIIDIALLAAVRGRGYGRAILTDILDEAGRAQKGVSLHVEKNNRAVCLYRRLGFIRIGEHGVYDLMERKSAASEG